MQDILNLGGKAKNELSPENLEGIGPGDSNGIRYIMKLPIHIKELTVSL